MARPRKLDPIRAVVQQLGQQIGQELAAAISVALDYGGIGPR